MCSHSSRDTGAMVAKVCKLRAGGPSRPRYAVMPIARFRISESWVPFCLSKLSILVGKLIL